jgi:hypothetical protein
MLGSTVPFDLDIEIKYFINNFNYLLKMVIITTTKKIPAQDKPSFLNPNNVERHY